MIVYDKLFKVMERKGINKFYLRKNGMHADTVDRLVKGDTVNISTIDNLCQLLDVQPGDILRYVPDDDDEDN